MNIVPDSSNSLQERLERRKLHEVHVVIILVMVLVIISTAKVGSSVEVNSYISFSATLSSFILAVFAIFLTLTGNSELSRFTSSVGMTNESLKTSATEMANSSNKTVLNSSQLQTDIDKLSNLVLGMEGKIESKFDKLTDQTKSLYLAQPAQTEKSSEIDAGFSKEDFLRVCAPAGLITLLYLARHDHLEERFYIGNFSKITEINPDYIAGFISACNAARIIKKSKIKNKIRLQNILFSSDDLERSVVKKINLFNETDRKGTVEKIQKMLNNLAPDPDLDVIEDKGNNSLDEKEEKKAQPEEDK